MTRTVTSSSSRRATVVGTGLIGGSLGLALRVRGWHVSGSDVTPDLVARGIELGAFDTEGIDPESSLVVVATPVGEVPAVARRLLEACPTAAVTDVGGVKAQVLRAVDNPRFVGGHPMAGSEQLGLEGADADLFQGAAWVLTPRLDTDNHAFALVRDMATSLGAEVLTLDAERHDALVAVVSHVPHLTAASLVGVAAERSSDHPALLRLAAGGFRDMTRIAAGSPTIWPDVCAQNRTAIVATLDRLISELDSYRNLVATDAGNDLLEALAQAQSVRRNLPTRDAADIDVVDILVPIPDRPGAVAAVAVLATGVGVNLRSLQTIDAAESIGGVLEMSVAIGDAEILRDALQAEGYRAVIVAHPEPGTAS